MTKPNNEPLHELLSFLQNSATPELNELAERLVAEESRVLEEKITNAHEREHHSVDISLSTDWDFFMAGADGSDDFSITFTGKSKADAITKLEHYFLDNSNYDHFEIHKDKIEGFQQAYLPNIISQLKTTNVSSVGGNWEIDAYYNTPQEPENPDGMLEFKLLGVTLSKREKPPAQDL
jgi:hypothetical protein